jgi:hypothetical protein
MYLKNGQVIYQIIGNCGNDTNFALKAQFSKFFGQKLAKIKICLENKWKLRAIKIGFFFF